MKQDFALSIIISSFNRDDKVLETVEHLFASDFGGFKNIELIIIDDGSPRPVEDALARLKEIPSVISLRLVKQKNSGIGATRNRGFREAQSDILLFLDDDILVKKETLKEIVKAHQDKPGSVFFGSYPFISHESESLKRFAGKLFGYSEITEEKKYEKVDAITSGLLSVNKAQLNGTESFYRDDMTIPAAEEYEIISRFHQLGIPIVHARHISAIHNHHLKLEWLVEQQYKYGLATAEAFLKKPEITEMPKFARLKQSLQANGLKGFLKSLLTTGASRKFLLRSAHTLENLFSKSSHDFIFGLLTSSYYWAGYREGLKRFSK
jgi:glycosyltransferase involved in cell wall biosynthesis